MKRTVEKVLKTGYGLGLLSIAEAKRAVHTVKRDFNLDEDESRHLARELVKSSGKLSKEVLDLVGRRLKTAMSKAGFKKSDLAMMKRMAARKVGQKLGLKRSTLQKIKHKISRKRR